MFAPEHLFAIFHLYADNYIASYYIPLNHSYSGTGLHITTYTMEDINFIVMHSLSDVTHCAPFPTEIRPPVVTSARRDGYYQSPNDCSKYLLCKASQCSVLSCSKPLVFNPETNTCQQASRVEKTYLSKCRM